MTPTHVPAQARWCGAVLLADDGRLRVKNSGSLPMNLRQAIIDHKGAILDLLRCGEFPNITERAEPTTPTDHPALMADALALFPGACVAADVPAADLRSYLDRFLALTATTYPEMPASGRAIEALRCLADVIQHPEATERIRLVATWCKDKMEAITAAGLEAKFGTE